MSDYALPSELTYTELSRLYPSRKMELRRQPFNASSFTPGSMAQIVIPKMDKAFLNCATNCLTFNCNVTLTAGATNSLAAADHRVYFLGNAWAPFRRYVVKQSGGQDLDQIDNVNVLVNKIMDLTTNPMEKVVNVSMGFHNSSPLLTVGHEFIPSANVNTNASTTISASFSIPLIGILGQTEKFIPLNTADLEINLTIEQVAEAFARALPTDATVSYTISNMEFVGEILQLEDAGYQQLLQMYPDGFKVKSQSWSYASGGSLPSQANGVQDLLLPFSLSSLKQFIWSCQPSSMWDGKFGSVNPNLSSYQLLIGGSPYPVQPVNASRVAEVYYQNSKSFGAFYSSGHSGCATRAQLAKSSTATGEYTAFQATPSPLTQTFVENDVNSNKFICALDLEMINQSKTGVYTGISTRGSTNTLRLNIGSQIASVSHAVHMFAGYDVQLTFDWRNGQILYSN